MNLLLWLHVIGAGLAVSLGALQLLLHKGGVRHRAVGYVWAISLLIAVISSFGIQEIGGLYGFSPIHLLSVYTLIGLFVAIHCARKGDIKNHRKNLVYLTLGISIAGIFTLFPGRRLGDFLWVTM